MSINPLEGDIATASDATLAKFHKKINELVKEANENFQSQLKLRNDIAALNKELREIKMRIMNLG